MQNSIEVLTADIYVLFLILGEKCCLSVFIMMLTLIDIFYMLMEIPFYSCLAKTFSLTLDFVNWFVFFYLDDYVVFSSQFDNMLKCIHRFSGV